MGDVGAVHTAAWSLAIARLAAAPAAAGVDVLGQRYRRPSWPVSACHTVTGMPSTVICGCPRP
jgi:hypothetical protein